MIHALWKAAYWAVVLSAFWVAYSFFLAGYTQRLEKKGMRLEVEWADARLVFEEGE